MKLNTFNYDHLIQDADLYEQLQKMGLPSQKMEHYRHIYLKELWDQEFDTGDNSSCDNGGTCDNGGNGLSSEYFEDGNFDTIIFKNNHYTSDQLPKGVGITSKAKKHYIAQRELFCPCRR